MSTEESFDYFLPQGINKMSCQIYCEYCHLWAKKDVGVNRDMRVSTIATTFVIIRTTNFTIDTIRKNALQTHLTAGGVVEEVSGSIPLAI